MFPPLQTSASFLPAKRSRSFSAAASGAAPGRLDQIARDLEQAQRRRAQLVVADEHEVVEMLGEDSLREGERDPRLQALGERVHLVLHQPAFAPRAIGGRRGVGLHADHLDACADRLGRDTRAGRAAAAADRHDDHLDLRLALEHLERRGRDAGDQQRLVARVDVASAASAAATSAQRSRASSKSAPCSTTSAPSDRIAATFTGLAPPGHEDRRRDAEQARRVRD